MDSKRGLLLFCFLRVISMHGMYVVKDDRHRSEFFLAARYGENKKIEQMLTDGFDVNTERDNFLKSTALLEAIQAKKSVTAELLLAKGACVKPLDFIWAMADGACEKLSCTLLEKIDQKSLVAVGTEYIFCFTIEHASFPLIKRVAGKLLEGTITQKLVHNPSWVKQIRKAIEHRKFTAEQAATLNGYLDIPKKTGCGVHAKKCFEKVKNKLLEAKN